MGRSSELNTMKVAAALHWAPGVLAVISETKKVGISEANNEVLVRPGCFLRPTEFTKCVSGMLCAVIVVDVLEGDSYPSFLWKSF